MMNLVTLHCIFCVYISLLIHSYISSPVDEGVDVGVCQVHSHSPLPLNNKKRRKIEVKVILQAHSNLWPTLECTYTYTHAQILIQTFRIMVTQEEEGMNSW